MPLRIGFGSRRTHRVLVVIALILGAFLAPNLATPAQAASSTGTWRYYGTGSSPITAAWHCGRTDSVGAPYYLSMQACVIKQGGSAQVAMIVNARAANNPVASSDMFEIPGEVFWDCGRRTFSLGLSVCFGGSATYSGSVSAEAAVRHSDGTILVGSSATA